MKMPKAQEPQKKEKKARRRKSSTAGELKEQDEPLFQKLRALRTEIAREEKSLRTWFFPTKLLSICVF